MLGLEYDIEDVFSLGGQPLTDYSDGFLRRVLILAYHNSDLLVDMERWVEGCFFAEGKENDFGVEMLHLQAKLILGHSLN